MYTYIYIYTKCFTFVYMILRSLKAHAGCYDRHLLCINTVINMYMCLYKYLYMYIHVCVCIYICM